MNTQQLKKYLIVDGMEYLDANGYWQTSLALAHRHPSLGCATANLRRAKRTGHPNSRMVTVMVTEQIQDDQRVHIA